MSNEKKDALDIEIVQDDINLSGSGNKSDAEQEANEYQGDSEKNEYENKQKNGSTAPKYEYASVRFGA